MSECLFLALPLDPSGLIPTKHLQWKKKSRRLNLWHIQRFQLLITKYFAVPGPLVSSAVAVLLYLGQRSDAGNTVTVILYNMCRKGQCLFYTNLVKICKANLKAKQWLLYVEKAFLALYLGQKSMQVNAIQHVSSSPVVILTKFGQDLSVHGRLLPTLCRIPQC